MLPVALVEEVERHAMSAAPLDQLAAALTRADRLAVEADALIDHFVIRARGAGHSWTEIGARLGVSKQAARQRFSAHVNRAGRDRLMPRVQRCLVQATELARRDGCDEVGTAHLLLALATGEGLAATVLSRLGLDVSRLEAAVQASAPETRSPSAARPDEGPQVVNALNGASSLAVDSYGHAYVDTEHVLQVLASDPGSTTHRLLAQLGIDPAGIEREVEACRDGGGRRATLRRRHRRRTDARCSFCGRRDDPANRLVSGPGVFICGDCARLAVEINGAVVHEGQR